MYKTSEGFSSSMKAWINRSVENIADLLKSASQQEKDEFLYKSLPIWSLKLLNSYFKVQVSGSEYLPREGRAIVISNHSGFAGFDALMLAQHIRENTQRHPRIMTHRLWFSLPFLKKISPNVGFVEARLEAAQQSLEKDQLLLMFPEGEEGNFKVSSKRYQLRDFRRGFIRLSVMTGAPIIPAIVLGAEESSITLGQINYLKKYFGLPIPLPLNLIPFPVQWTIKFFPPIDTSSLSKDDLNDNKKIVAFSKKIRHDLQKKILHELKLRKNISLKGMKIDRDDLP